MPLLHFRRTFVEKLFTIHSEVQRLLEDGTAVGRDARHYADLHVLAQQPEVIAMLESGEYAEIRRDYHAQSTHWFPQGHRPPPELRFADSEALFPTGKLRERLEAGYREQGALLFPAAFATFDEVSSTFERIRDLL